MKQLMMASFPFLISCLYIWWNVAILSGRSKVNLPTTFYSTDNKLTASIIIMERLERQPISLVLLHRKKDRIFRERFDGLPQAVNGAVQKVIELLF
jgi:hypothetical protein